MESPARGPHPDLPPLAGIATFAQAMRPGLSVEDCVTRLKRIHYSLKRLHQIFIWRLASEPVYELKMAFSLHAYYCAEHIQAFRKRVGEMREPPLGLDSIPSPDLEILFDEILSAPTTLHLLVGLYETALPALRSALQELVRDTNPLADQPSVRICKFAELEVEEMLHYGLKVLSNLRQTEDGAPDSAWLNNLESCLTSAGGINGLTPSPDSTSQRITSSTPAVYDGRPRRDSRFTDPYNMGVNAEVFLYDADFPPAPKTLMMFYKRLREIDVPEMMASILAETPDKPWEYYQDLTRQLWDEARHAMMGEVGFLQAGIDWQKVPVNFTWSLALNTQLKPIERHAVLYFIEQGLMPRTGKRFEWEVGLASGNPLAALFQDYDWADEVLHARIGRDWYLPEFSDPKTAVQYGDSCWSKVLMNWSKWKELGLTEHRNWWPDIYEAACKHWGIPPDPKVLAYSTSYESVRADLRELSASA